MHETPERVWSVESVASEIAMSRPAFAHRFKSVVGTTPPAYLSGIRLDRAARFLRDPDDSEFTFSRERGIAPGRYRRTSIAVSSSR
ncbi:AraC family transcriptional regulator [Prauserella cavernicola]|uniref:Helix-turn-helix transcriptional regulator n=1 Tax=Prauserella cavernicola TaxID=2800127 RepID=A0A934QNU7_9PSEU|nr:AraC family transcriptional regulator [Prauserella cavernicola]MBK1785482.1 helix-turn-helix transcriptional regulator [Prauserella cavernicola]